MKTSKLIAFIFIGILLFFAVILSANSTPAEVWLTPARLAALKRVSSRPRITKRDHLPNGNVVYTWTNNVHGFTTTQEVKRVFGKKSKSAWQEKLDRKDREKKALVENIRILRTKLVKESSDTDDSIGSKKTKGK